MRKLILLVIAFLFGVQFPISANVVDGSIKESDAIKNLQSKQLDLEKTIGNLLDCVGTLSSDISFLKRKNDSLNETIDSLKVKTVILAEKDNSIEGGLTDANKKIDDNAKASDNKISSRTAWGIGAGVVLLVVALLVYLILYRRINSKTSSINTMKKVQDELQKAQTALQEESLKLDNKMIELLDKQLDVSKQQVSQPASSSQKPDHSLALKVADDVRIKTNLMRMDASVRGHKQLSKAVERIEANFLANGYEIVDMLGKPYYEGMKCVASFVIDETLPEGSQKITRVIKPQINYNDVMIQAAQIEVSQNI